ncbi:hypothetical protein E2C00_16660 [Streptomyces sp. WAC05374]|nr:hypothetical protein EF905_21240 [Streptomyces sp. WAC05374]TDF54560.1 hypothetical protein E2C00_16660 [Streptomyces sp. WAC05374]TDF56195.1 hypothetical protein E2C02_12115 [Streptomyces sp. WAC05374]
MPGGRSHSRADAADDGPLRAGATPAPVQRLGTGLLSDLPGRNCWTMAEHIRDNTPDGLQRPLRRAKWDAGLARDDLRGHVLQHLADKQAVFVMDETGDLKRGTHTVGVQRQYIGTACRTENSQVAGLPHRHRPARARGYRPGPGRRDNGPLGQPATRSTATTRNFEPPLEARELGYVPVALCANRIQARPARSAPTPCSRSYRATPGRSCPPDAARGSPLVRLSSGRDNHRPAGRTPAPADPPQPHHRGAGLLPLPCAPPGPAQHPGHSRGQSLDRRGDVAKFRGIGGT